MGFWSLIGVYKGYFNNFLCKNLSFFSFYSLFFPNITLKQSSQEYFSRIRVGAWLGRLDMWLGLCPNDLLTSCAMLTGSVGLIGDGYHYNTGKLRPGHADHFEYFNAK